MSGLPASEPHPPSSPLYHYVIIRRDLPIGVLAANIIHAAGESVTDPLGSDTRAVALSTADEAALRAVANRLAHAQVIYREIVETEGAYAGQLMALGVTPVPRSVVYRYLSDIPLLR